MVSRRVETWRRKPARLAMALALLLEQAQRADSWSEAYLERLHQYRADRSLMVATVAQFTFPEEEEV